MHTTSFIVAGYNIGLSEIMLIVLGLFVLFLIIRNIILYQIRPQAK